MFKQLPLSVTLLVDATFDSFYVSDENAMTVFALKQFCQHSDEHCFFLSGQSGSGVTHLLQAVQHYVDHSNIQYLPLKECILHPRSPQEVLSGLESLDLIVIDDLHLVAGEEDWELALFHLYNRLRDHGKQLLIGSQVAPRELEVALPDLQSRLQWGMAYQLYALNDNEKKQALIFRAEALGMRLSDDVTQFILNHCSRNIHPLMDILELMDNASLAEQRHLTIPFVKQVLKL